jgi:hypothetical protein
MGKLMLSVLLGVCPLLAEDQGPSPRGAPETAARATFFHGSTALWRYSVTALAVTNILDAQSSWGKRELNPDLSGHQGTFGLHGALLKLGIQGGVFGLEYLVLHRRPGKNLYRVLSVFNFACAGVTGATAVHNYTIPGR